MAFSHEFDDGRLDDANVLVRHDELLRNLALAGARVRVEAAAAEACYLDLGLMPRGIVLAGLESRLIRAVVEFGCPSPLVAWPYDGLPGWAGPLDLLVVQDSGMDGAGLVSTVTEAARRGCSMLVAAPGVGALDEYLPGRGVVKVTTSTSDPVAAVVALLDVLSRAGLGPSIVAESIAEAADMVAEECSPHKDLSSNPAKSAAIALADGQPLVWGGSMLAARAARRTAEEIRRITGRPALAAPASDLAPLLMAADVRDPFADPDEQPDYPVLITLDDGEDGATAGKDRVMLDNIAEARQLRVIHMVCDDAQAGPVGRHVSLLQQGMFAAAYLGVGLDRVAG